MRVSLETRSLVARKGESYVEDKGKTELSGVLVGIHMKSLELG